MDQTSSKNLDLHQHNSQLDPGQHFSKPVSSQPPKQSILDEFIAAAVSNTNAALATSLVTIPNALSLIMAMNKD